MTSYEHCDASVETLARLQSLLPDSRRAESVRVRCRTQLSRRRQYPAGTVVRAGFARGVLAPVVVGAFCVLYVAALVTTTLRLHGIFD
jgi:hypothetical protein